MWDSNSSEVERVGSSLLIARDTIMKEKVNTMGELIGDVFSIKKNVKQELLRLTPKL